MSESPTLLDDRPYNEVFLDFCSMGHSVEEAMELAEATVSARDEEGDQDVA